MVARVKWLPFRIVAITICRGLVVAKESAPYSVIAHEQVHEKEWTPLWLARYLLSPMFRMKAEVRGYKVQAQKEEVTLSHYLDTISNGYWLSQKAKDQLPKYAQTLT